MTPAGSRRIRRSAQASRALLLDVAERRLSEFGVGGLKIADVAREAGLSHGTLLHHFGSSDGLRIALATRMAQGLLDEVIALERDGPEAEEAAERFFERLFAVLSGGGHARLIAWLSLDDTHHDEVDALVSSTGERFELLLQTIASRMLAADEAASLRQARYIVLLVVSSAIGVGVARDVLFSELDLDAEDEGAYARWLSQLVRPQVLGSGDAAESAPGES